MYFDCICILVNSLNNFTVLSKVPGERVFDDAGVSVHVTGVEVVHSDDAPKPLDLHGCWPARSPCRRAAACG